jgi:hypothetical protein
MRQRRFLIALNAVLAITLLAVALAPQASAQRGGAAGGRARGDFTMIAGKIQGGNGSAIYIVDANNQDMIALRWNQGTKALDGIGYRDLQEDSRLTTPGGR